MKTYTTSPPDMLPINEKYLGLQYIANVIGIIITSNHKTDGIYLPADDRRHYVAWSDRTIDDFEEGYWKNLYDWYDHGGYEHVAAYLAQLDISTRKHRHRRQMRFIKSRPLTSHQRARGWRTRSMKWEGRTPQP